MFNVKCLANVTLSMHQTRRAEGGRFRLDRDISLAELRIIQSSRVISKSRPSLTYLCLPLLFLSLDSTVRSEDWVSCREEAE